MPPNADSPQFPQSLVLGTRNRKKQAELEALLAPLQVVVRSLEDFPAARDIVEDGTTFAENARKKASEQAQNLGQWVLGEDSGLVVAALHGAPGVYSARFSGDNATDQSNNDLLIERLREVPAHDRGAHYVCCAALANPDGHITLEVTGECHGRLRKDPVGTEGFGYDPLFEVLEYHQTFGELGPDAKNLISHRGRAIRAFARQLAALRIRER